MIPLYGFLEGDTIGLLVLAEANDTMDALAVKLRAAAAVRVANDPAKRRVVVDGRSFAPSVTVATAGLEALDCFDVVRDS